MTMGYRRAVAGTLLAATAFGLVRCSSFEEEAPTVDAGSDAGVGQEAGPDVLAPDGNGPRCDRARPFAAPELVSALEIAAAGGGSAGAHLSRDELTVYFQAFVAVGARLHRATRPSRTASFGAVVQLELGSDAGMGEGHAALSPDGDRLFFHRSAPSTSADLYVSTIFADGGLSVGAPLLGLSTAQSERTVFADNAGALWLALGDDDAGTFSAQRIARAQKLSATEFQAPMLVPLGTVAPADEGDPVLSQDGLTLYYASNRGSTVGDYNIWVASRSTPDGAFDPPEPVAELNTVEPELPSWISADQCELYFSGFRSGRFHVYRAFRRLP